MMVYGIRCHLQYKFNISGKEWSRICQNMDSKCRSAWKRKLKHARQQQNKVIKVSKTSANTEWPKGLA